MNICLVTVPSEFLLDNKVFMSLGILKVAASLEQTGHVVEHLDLAGVSNYQDVVRDHCRQTQARVFGITATSPQMPAAMRVLESIKKVLPDAHVILGGPHPTLIHAAQKLEAKRGIEGRAHRSLQELSAKFDSLVAGDGERAVHQAIARRGIVDADDPKSELWLTSEGFTESPWPARHLVDVESYHYYIEGVRSLSAIFQLGCPYMCSFCAGRNSPMLRRVRLRTSESAIAEIIHMYERYGITGYMTLDDELNVNREMLGLMRGLKQAGDSLGVQWAFRGFLKAELFTEEQAEALVGAGFRQLLIGFESGSERILTNIQKKATRADNTRAMDIARRHGLKVKALMSVGHAGESERTIMDTLDWLLEVRPSDFDVTIITPYPGCSYYDDAVPQGGSYCYTAPKTGDKLYMTDVDFGKDAHYYKGAPGSYVSYVWTDHISAERLVEMRDEVEHEVRTKLGIPFYQAAAAQAYDHSCGQTHIPSHILRRSQQVAGATV